MSDTHLRFRPVATEPAPVRAALILTSVAFLAVLLFAPLIVVFVEALRDGAIAAVASLANPEAASAIRLTLIVAALAVPHIANHPEILGALSPHHALRFIWNYPGTTFIILGAVVLCVTGGEALYADMGHFGKKPIRLAWFSVVMPCLILNYFGQGALLLADPEAEIDAPELEQAAAAAEAVSASAEGEEQVA